MADGLVIVDILDKERLIFSQKLACPDCGVVIEELSPRMFSFNSPPLEPVLPVTVLAFIKK